MSGRPPAFSRRQRRGTHAEKVAVLKAIGVLTSLGKLARSSTPWRNKTSRTPLLED
jgi:hypothetical protein